MSIKEHSCIICNKRTVSVIKTEEGHICYNCYSDKKNPSKQKQHHDNEEARIQSEFFNKVPLFFPNLPDRLLFAVPNGGSRHKIEAANMKRKGVCFPLFGVQDIDGKTISRSKRIPTPS